MKNKILLLVISISTIFCFENFAQQEAQYTQYMYNTMSINPAYAGSREVLSIVGLYRTQWVGLEGAPNTQTLSVHSPIGSSEKLGLGLSIVNDNIGPTHETNFDIDLSYTLHTSDKGRFSFGLKAGGHLMNINYDELNRYNEGDAVLPTGSISEFSPNVGVGLYYRHADKWYLGVSAPNLLETEHLDEISLSTAKERIHYYLIGGYVFDLTENLKFKPAFLGKAVEGAPLQVDLTANFLINDKLTLGAAYRWSAAVSALAGFQITEGLMIGLAYDRETTELGKTKFNDGSYEIMLRFELFKKDSKIISPRFF
ncbi:type IX secretion system membrane protein PorP/SprF [Oceanihabitans sp. 2_MG-2023]|uniref:PorP/SprF family type IX secretion system membrane protein n=1 Tax=Oceanihabitans sp. 2_MG-2023 TaxID=3062661 RepID=UPI0026E2859F|nr:type IX secretion system membrane protein PorP/SprF [Oceanihabitans sp. 2_MG-2023]MDO6598341.1 type IX secretion system membrane protein PorP/SprF [Oceanihabitans sp. 2_MG-2023]